MLKEQYLKVKEIIMKKLKKIPESKAKNEIINRLKEDENLGDKRHLHAKNMFKKDYKDLTDEEKKKVHMKETKRGWEVYDKKTDKVFSQVDSEAAAKVEKSRLEKSHKDKPGYEGFGIRVDESIDKFKNEIKNRVSEAISKAEQESIIEQAEAIIKETQTNYANDVMYFTGITEAFKKTERDYDDLKKTVESKYKEIENASAQIKESAAKIKELEKKLEESKQTVESKIEEVSNMQITLDEARKSHANKLIEEKIRTIAGFTGLKLNDQTIESLKECKTDDELKERLEEVRDRLAKNVLHENLKATAPTSINIVENIPAKPDQYVRGVKVNGILDMVGEVMNGIN